MKTVRPLLLLVTLLWLSPSLLAQQDIDPVALEELLTETPSASNNNIGPVGIIPVQKGLNVSLSNTSLHDSSNGWASILSPTAAYRFNRMFSADVAVPIFLYVRTTSAGGTTAKPTTVVGIRDFLAGDTALAGHMELQLPLDLAYTFTGTLSLPSGDSSLGLGSGHVQYDFNNHFESDLPFSPYVEVGIGNSTALLNRRVRRTQNSTGTVSHFEAGGSFDLPYAIALNLSAYEFLPIGDQKIYSTRVVRKKTVTTITGTSGLAEDNGFNTSLDIPLQSHLTLSGLYSRSLRQHLDTAGFTLTWFSRPRPPQ